MKTIKNILLAFLATFGVTWFITQCLFFAFGPKYPEGEYVMTYKVYYSQDNTKEYTITNNLPIDVTSYRGTNSVRKAYKIPIFEDAYEYYTVFDTSAPIEVVNYSFKEIK